jgi:hypothetical protein
MSQVASFYKRMRGWDFPSGLFFWGTHGFLRDDFCPEFPCQFTLPLIDLHMVKETSDGMSRCKYHGTLLVSGWGGEGQCTPNLEDQIIGLT